MRKEIFLVMRKSMNHPFDIYSLFDILVLLYNKLQKIVIRKPILSPRLPNIKYLDLHKYTILVLKIRGSLMIIKLLNIPLAHLGLMIRLNAQMMC